MTTTHFFSRSAFLKIVLFILLFLGGFHSFDTVVSDLHDPGSHAVGEYWTVHGLHYGVDIVQNIGPLGFINYPATYTGFLSYEKLAVVGLLAIVFAYLTLEMAWLIPSNAVKALFLLLSWLITDTDSQLYLLSLLIAYALFFSSSLRKSLTLILVLVLLSLAKSTLMFIALFIVCFSTLRHLVARRWILAVLIPGGYVFAFIASWSLLGQPVTNIFSFIQAALHFTAGYNEAMSIFENPSKTILGVLSLIAAGAGIALHRFSQMRGRSASYIADGVGLAIIEVFILFVAWKHGFVRADDHVIIYFGFLAAAASLYLWLSLPGEETILTKKIFLRWILLAVIVIPCLIGFERIYHFTGPGKIPAYKWSRMKENAYILSDIRGYFQKLDERLMQSTQTLDMPQVNAVAGGQEVSYFGMLPAMMVYNHFTYRPMPATISFAAWNFWIMEKDAAFFRNDASAPRYLLYNLKSTSNRLTAQDDSLAQLELLQRYDIALTEKGNFLLKRRSNAPKLSLKPELAEKQYSLEEWINVPPMNGSTWIRIDVPGTAVGKLLSFLYKPSEYDIEYSLANGKTYTNKMITGTARVGFMIAPLITTDAEFLAANNFGEYARYQAGQSDKLSRIVKFRLHCTHEKISCSKAFIVAFDSIQGLGFGRMPDDQWQQIMTQFYSFVPN